jgi:UDP-N-acetylglucosamine acyltransferase
MIHPSATIDPGARIADGVEIGAYCVIGDAVEIEAGTRIGPHTVIHGPTRIGRDNRLHGQSAIGGDPQDMKFSGEHAELIIGERNSIREFVTINRGTAGGGGVTRIGNDNWIQAYAHIAHDCQVGNHCILSNNATLAGHVILGDWVIISGFAGAHQFCKIGAHAFIGMGCLVNGDVPPYLLMADDYGRPRGINAEGLKRRGFEPERIAAIKRAYRALYLAGKPREEALQALAELAADSADVAAFLEFVKGSERGLVR